MVKKVCRNQSKSIKFVTSGTGHVDGIKNEQTITHQLLIRIKQNSSDRKSCETADAKNLVVKVTHLVPGPF